MFQLVILLAVVVLSGSVARRFGFTRGGHLASMAVGFAGAALGGWIAGWLGLPGVMGVAAAGLRFDLLWSFLGCALLATSLGRAFSEA